MAPGVSISLYYFAFLAALGFYWPYFSLYLASLGLAPTEITRLMSLGPAMGVVMPLALGLLADARRARVWLLRLASIGAALAFAALFHAGTGRAWLYAGFLLFALFRAPVSSLVDASAVDHALGTGGSFGALRVWGSVGFLVAVLGGGALVQEMGPTAMVGATTLALCAASLCAFAIPAPKVHARAHILRAWVAMLGDGKLWLLLGAVVLAQAAGAAYDGCFSLHLARLGYGSRFTGLAWGVGVASEVVLLALSGRLIRRFGAERLLTFALGTAAARWLALGHVTTAPAILALQPLHGITFGFFYASGVTLLRERAGHATPTAAQGLFGASLGAGTVAGMAVAGRLLEQEGGAALFTIASAVAVMATILAWRFTVVAERTRALPVPAALG